MPIIWVEDMMMSKYVMAIDEGTTSTRAMIFDHEHNVVSMAQKEFTQYFPHPGWVEHDANEILLAVQAVMASSLMEANLQPTDIAAIGITNQRETTVVWNKETGLPIYRAIVWQSRQTADICDELKEKGYVPLFEEKTGLKIDAYFSATKIRWILDHVEGAQQMAEEGKLLAGTIDSWLVYYLSGQKVHITDYTNASRTLLYNIYEKKWDEELCRIMNIPMCMLPEVRDSSCVYGTTADYRGFGAEIPIAGIAGDQQAALFGQGCFDVGSVKNTYGTGCFMLVNTGAQPMKSESGLVTTIAWGLNGEITYALEGSIFVAGSAIQWLRDELHFFEKASMSEEMALRSKNDRSVILVPAFVGLGAPYWDDRCRGALFGLTRGTTVDDITKATLDSLAYQTRDILEAMEKDIGKQIDTLKVDGGASANNYMMQFQADLIQHPVIRPASVESTAIGAANLAGLAVGYWTMDDLRAPSAGDTIYTPLMAKKDADKYYQRWQTAVAAARMFPADE